MPKLLKDVYSELDNVFLSLNNKTQNPTPKQTDSKKNCLKLCSKRCMEDTSSDYSSKRTKLSNSICY